MASQNEVFLCGFLEEDVISEGNQQLFILTVRARKVENTFYGKFQRVFIRYDGSRRLDADTSGTYDRLYDIISNLKKGDVVLVKGVLNITVVNRIVSCDTCGMRFIKPYTTSIFVYPIYVRKIDTIEKWADSEAKEQQCAKILSERYREISNNVSLMGKLTKEPEIVNMGMAKTCRYQLTIGRKYYIKTQSDLTYDNPYVYSYNEQGEMDSQYLKKGATVQVSGFIQTRKVKNRATCSYCNSSVVYDDIATEVVPYSVEYLRGYRRFDAEGNALKDPQEELENEKFTEDK